MNFSKFATLPLLLGYCLLNISCGVDSKSSSSQLHGGSDCRGGIARMITGTNNYYNYTAYTTGDITKDRDKVSGCYYPTEEEARKSVEETCRNAQTYVCDGQSLWVRDVKSYTFQPTTSYANWIFINKAGTQFFHDGKFNTFCGLISLTHRDIIVRKYGLDPKKVTVYDADEWQPNPGRDIGICAPLPPPDTDGDEIPDSRDKCVTERENYNNYQDSDGCPDTTPPPDRNTYMKEWYAGFIMNKAGTGFYTNGQGHYCGFVSEQHFNMGNGNWDEAKRRVRGDAEFKFFENDGLCRVGIPAGYYTDNTSAIYYSNGINATCHIATPAQVLGPVTAYDFPVHTTTSLQFTGMCRLTSLQAVNVPGHFVRHRNNFADLTPVSSGLDQLDASWNIVPGLSNSSCISFESRNKPGYFLRHAGFRVTLAGFENSDVYRNDVTFCERPGRSNSAQTSFESINYPGYFLRHQNFELKLQNDNDAQAQADSTFTVIQSFQ